MSIDLQFNSEQQLIQQTARDFFEKRCPMQMVRQYADSDEEFPRDVWQEMAELGWLGMTFPEDYGGFACSILDVYGIYVEAGRSLAPVPMLDSIAIGGGLIARLGTEAQKQALLPRVSAGDALIVPAITEPDGIFGAEGINLQATTNSGRVELTGVKVLVPYVKSAERLVVAARLDMIDGPAGIGLFLVDPAAAGVTVERNRSIAGCPVYALTFSNCACEPLGTREPGTAWDALEAVLSEAAVLQAAVVVGAGERILNMTTEYAKQRVQFGKPIGHYQAVQYLCTDIAMELHVTRLLALHAAWRIESRQSFLREAAMAKAQACKAAAVMTSAAHEVHAGTAFMEGYDLQLFTRRAKYWEYNLGDRRHHLSAVAQMTDEVVMR